MSTTDRSASTNLTRRAAKVEAGMWRSLYRWVTRRPVTEHPSDTPFGYSSLQAPIVWAFIGVSTIEIPVVHLILPWRVAEIIALVISIWGLLWMFGYMGSLKTYPHLVGDAGLRVRQSVMVDIPITWDDVASISARRRNLPTSKGVQRTETDSGKILHVGVTGQTNVDVTLRRPILVPLLKGDELVTAIHFYADDSKALVARAREYLTADAPNHS